ncbi:hypothetical protein BDR04DRAFT_1182220 [Suillus decipiens]|nr:hypothetical protein BDR04DRAFT_1182220 [Suillus decipiens]
MLVHHKEHCPHLFWQKHHVNPEIFDDILNYISDHFIFQNQSNNPQLPVSIQLAIFLNWAGHYGNAITLEDVAQWACVCVGSMVNCTNCVMIAFVCFLADNSEDADLACKFAESCTCPEWKSGFLVIDGSTMDLFTKASYYGETFFDRKPKYSLGYQAVILPHNLFIMDYALGHPRNHADLLPDGHWVWADSEYSLEPWCIAPFKKPCNGWFTKNQKTFNYHLSKICVHVEHTFAVLKGQFQSL